MSAPAFLVSIIYIYIHIYIYNYLKRSLNSYPDDMHCAFCFVSALWVGRGACLCVCAANKIGAEGMIPLSEALKLNVTLTSVNLGCECALWFRSLFFFRGYDHEIHPGLKQITQKKSITFCKLFGRTSRLDCVAKTLLRDPVM